MKRVLATLIWLLAALAFLSLPILVGMAHGGDAIVSVDGGGGVVVTPDGLVLTCKHGLGPENTIDVLHRTKGRLASEIVHRPAAVDGVVAIRLPYGSYEFIPVSPRFPQKKDHVIAVHFNGDRLEGKLLGSELVTTDIYAGQSLKLNVASMVAEPGWSGGPLLDDNGGVIGILLASNRRTTAFTPYMEVCWVVENAPPAKHPAANERPAYQINVEIYTATWCDACQRLKREIEANPTMFARWRFTFVDVTSSTDWGGDQLPFLICNGRYATGYRSAADLLKWLESIPDPVSPAEAGSQPYVREDRPQTEAVASVPLTPIPDPTVPPATKPGESPTPFADSSPVASQPIPQPMQPAPPPHTQAPPAAAARTETGPLGAVVAAADQAWTVYSVLKWAGIASGIGGPAGLAFGIGWKVGTWAWGAMRSRRRREQQTAASGEARAGPYGPAINYHVPALPIFRVPDSKAIDSINEAFARSFRSHAADEKATQVLEQAHEIFRAAMAAPRH